MFVLNSFRRSILQPKRGFRKSVVCFVSPNIKRRTWDESIDSSPLQALTKPYFNRHFNKARLKQLVFWSLMRRGEKKTIDLVEILKTKGYYYATMGGISLSIDDLIVPPTKMDRMRRAEVQLDTARRSMEAGHLTHVEYFTHVINVWNNTNDQMKQEVIHYFKQNDILNPVYMMAFSGARGNISQVRQLVGMRGLMSDPSGQIIDFAIQSNFREGLTLTEYMISCYGARKGVVDTALRTATSGYLTRRLVDVAQHVIIQSHDCQTLDGISFEALTGGQRTLLSLKKRLLGRVLNVPVYDAKGLQLASRNQEIHSELAHQLVRHPKSVSIRSPLTCQDRNYICQLCYGWDNASGRLVSLGESVGVIAAQSIGEPGTQLTMRTFHTGGVFSGDVSDEIRASLDGFVDFPEPIVGQCVRTHRGQMAFLIKQFGRLIVFNSKKTIMVKLAPASLVFVKQGQKIRKNHILAEITHLSEVQEHTEAFQTIHSTMGGEVRFETTNNIRVETQDERTFEEEEMVLMVDEEKQKNNDFVPAYFSPKSWKKIENLRTTANIGHFWILSLEKQALNPISKTGFLTVFSEVEKQTTHVPSDPQPMFPDQGSLFLFTRSMYKKNNYFYTHYKSTLQKQKKPDHLGFSTWSVSGIFLKSNSYVFAQNCRQIYYATHICETKKLVWKAFIEQNRKHTLKRTFTFSSSLTKLTQTKPVWVFQLDPQRSFFLTHALLSVIIKTKKKSRQHRMKQRLNKTKKKGLQHVSILAKTTSQNHFDLNMLEQQLLEQQKEKEKEKQIVQSLRRFSFVSRVTWALTKTFIMFPKTHLLIITMFVPRLYVLNDTYWTPRASYGQTYKTRTVKNKKIFLISKSTLKKANQKKIRRKTLKSPLLKTFKSPLLKTFKSPLFIDVFTIQRSRRYFKLKCMYPTWRAYYTFFLTTKCLLNAKRIQTYGYQWKQLQIMEKQIGSGFSTLIPQRTPTKSYETSILWSFVNQKQRSGFYITTKTMNKKAKLDLNERFMDPLNSVKLQPKSFSNKWASMFKLCSLVKRKKNEKERLTSIFITPTPNLIHLQKKNIFRSKWDRRQDVSSTSKSLLTFFYNGFLFTRHYFPAFSSQTEKFRQAIFRKNPNSTRLALVNKPSIFDLNVRILCSKWLYYLQMQSWNRRLFLQKVKNVSVVQRKTYGCFLNQPLLESQTVFFKELFADQRTKKTFSDFTLLNESFWPDHNIVHFKYPFTWIYRQTPTDLTRLMGVNFKKRILKHICFEPFKRYSLLLQAKKPTYYKKNSYAFYTKNRGESFIGQNYTAFKRLGVNHFKRGLRKKQVKNGFSATSQVQLQGWVHVSTDGFLRQHNDLHKDTSKKFAGNINLLSIFSPHEVDTFYVSRFKTPRVSIIKPLTNKQTTTLKTWKRFSKKSLFLKPDAFLRHEDGFLKNYLEKNLFRNKTSSELNLKSLTLKYSFYGFVFFLQKLVPVVKEGWKKSPSGHLGPAQRHLQKLKKLHAYYRWLFFQRVELPFIQTLNQQFFMLQVHYKESYFSMWSRYKPNLCIQSLVALNQNSDVLNSNLTYNPIFCCHPKRILFRILQKSPTVLMETLVKTSPKVNLASSNMTKTILDRPFLHPQAQPSDRFKPRFSMQRLLWASGFHPCLKKALQKPVPDPFEWQPQIIEKPLLKLDSVATRYLSYSKNKLKENVGSVRKASFPTQVKFVGFSELMWVTLLPYESILTYFVALNAPTSYCYSKVRSLQPNFDGEILELTMSKRTSSSMISKRQTDSVLNVYPKPLTEVYCLTNKNMVTYRCGAKDQITQPLGSYIHGGGVISRQKKLTHSGQLFFVSKTRVVLRRASYFLLPVGSRCTLKQHDFVERHTPVLTLRYNDLKTEDIVQGIPKIERVFEARKISQNLSLPQFLQNVYTKYKPDVVFDQAFRRSIFLNTLQEVQKYIINTIQTVYQSQGVHISDKHIEVIVKQMTSKVVITHPGDTGLLQGDIVNLTMLEMINHHFVQEKAYYEPVILGITKASLQTKGFLSAASFQETVRILSHAAIMQKKDFLEGLKENVILGYLLPIGTGYNLPF